MTNDFLCIKSKISKDIWQWMGTTGNFGAPVNVSFVKIHQAMHMVRTSLVAQTVKVSAYQETQVWSLGQEDPLAKEMAIHYSTRALKIPWKEKPGRLQSMGSQRVRHDWVTLLSLSCTGEGNGNPLQCSCLENPRDWGGWGAAVYEVAQSRTRLKWLSSSSSKTHVGFLFV